MTRLRLLLLVAMLSGLASPAWPHEINLSTARVALTPDRTVTVEAGLKGSDVDRLVGSRTYDARADAVDPAAVAAASAAILAYFKTHIAVTAGGSACEERDATVVADGDGILFRASFSCGNIAGDIAYRSTVLTENNSAARQIVLIAQGGREVQALLDAGNSSVMLSAPAPSLSSTMRRYLVTGIEHIFLGYDHIAFLIAVMLWARRLVPVIKIVTAFTIAHSLTLSLAALGVVVIPNRIVEPAIAASIMYVALENFFSRDIDRRWRITFVFGLIHGFGFAGALQEIGLPPNAVVPALAAFNIGVELGQIAIVAVVLPLLSLLDRLTAVDRATPARAARLVYTVSLAIGLLGGYWFVTRVVEV
jgi:hydrogenase/urease accessory protein HupE